MSRETPPHGLEGVATGAAPDDESQRLFKHLQYVDSPLEAVAILRDELPLEEKYIAKAAGVRPESVSRWLKGDVESVHARDRINDLRCVVLVMLAKGRLSKSLIAYWLTSRNLYLGIEPVEAIAQDRFEDVAEVALAHVEGRLPTDGPGLMGMREPGQPLSFSGR